MRLRSKSLYLISKQFVSRYLRFVDYKIHDENNCLITYLKTISYTNFLTAEPIKLLSVTMPTAGTWKVPFRGKFGAYDANLRVVPPFSVQSLQKATVVQPPPRCHSAGSRLSKSKTTFKR